MSQSASLQSSVCILPLVCSLQSVFYPWSAVFSLYCTPWSAVFSLYFTPGLQSSVCILPLVYSLQSVFYPWSTVFSLFFTPGLQSSVCILPPGQQSSVCILPLVCSLHFTLIDTIILDHVVLFFTCLSVIQYVRCTFCRLMPAFCFP